jgi:antitoxin (DNA-binding transcriptional repressor) of toxin-antitoxin stability system
MLGISYICAMKTIELQDSGLSLSDLVREIEGTGEAVLVLRNGKAVARLEATRSVTEAERQKAFEELMESIRSNPGAPSDPDVVLTRDQLHER